MAFVYSALVVLTLICVFHSTHGMIEPDIIIKTVLTCEQDDHDPVCGEKLYGCVREQQGGKERRIVGGKKAVDMEFPWQVGLLYMGAFMCGGTLIHPEWVLTAAHCVDEANPLLSAYSAVVGTLSFRDVPAPNKFDIKGIYTHEEYDSKTYKHDIAMIQLAKPVDLRATYARTACLPATTDDFHGEICECTGWGSTSNDSDDPVVDLRKVRVKVQTDATCNETMPDTYRSFHLCAGVDLGRKDTCTGDSGGPMVCEKTTTLTDGRVKVHWALAGVVSTGFGCAHPKRFGLYTKVQEYLPWIANVVHGNGDD